MFVEGLKILKFKQGSQILMYCQSILTLARKVTFDESGDDLTRGMIN